jgi:hypothetical protein
MKRQTATHHIQAAPKVIKEREILVLRRYYIKQDYAPKGLHKGDVVLVIRSDKGAEYTVTLRRNKAHSCTCPSVKPCYHIKTMVGKENARYATEKAVKMPAQEVVSPKGEEMAEAAVKEAEKIVTPQFTNLFKRPSRWLSEQIEKQESYREIKAQAREIRERREYAPLNGNRAFSLMR